MQSVLNGSLSPLGMKSGGAAAVPPLTNLTHYWSFGNAAGFPYTGELGGRELTNNTVNQTRDSAGLIDYCAKNTVTGSSNNRIYTTATGIVTPASGSYSIAFWMNPTNWPSLSYVLGENHTSVLAWNCRYYIRQHTNGIEFRASNGGAWGTSLICGPITNFNRWYLMVFGFNSATNFGTWWVKDVNGDTDLKVSANVSYGGANMSGTYFWLFCAIGNTANFVGRLDEVAVYSRLLGDSDVAWMFNSGAGRTFGDYY